MELTLRHILESDFFQIKKYVSSKFVTKYLTWDVYDNDKSILKYINNIKNKKSKPDETLGIVYNGLLIGTIHIIAREMNNIQFGFGILEEYWGKGIGTKAVKISLNYIINNWGKDLVILGDIHKDNKIGKKVLEKNNFFYTDYIVAKDRERYIFLT